MWKNRVKTVLKAIQTLSYDRVEPRGLALGIPDITITTPAGHGWIELKVTGPMKLQTIMLPSMTPQQYNWIHNRGKKAGRVWVLVWDKEFDWMYFFDHTALWKEEKDDKVRYFAKYRLVIGSEKANNKAYWIEKIQEETNKEWKHQRTTR